MMLQALNRVSSYLGHDPLLTQGGGGNISLKDSQSNTIWVKASGKWLKNAEKENIYIGLDLAKGKAWLESRTLEFPNSWYKGAHTSSLLPRPSIEPAMHLLFDQKVVIHTHPISILSQSSQPNSEEFFSQALNGLAWAYIPYVKPGNELAFAIEAHPAYGKCNIYILKNHGLITCANNAEACSALTKEVVARCARPARSLFIASSQLSALKNSLSSNCLSPTLSQYHLADNTIINSLAIDPISLDLFSPKNNVLYPDQAVFLGTNARIVQNLAEIKDAEKVPFVVVKNHGVLIYNDSPPMLEEMLACHAQVLGRIPPNTKLDYLSENDVGELINWDAEKYRKLMS